MKRHPLTSALLTVSRVGVALGSLKNYLMTVLERAEKVESAGQPALITGEAVVKAVRSIKIRGKSIILSEPLDDLEIVEFNEPKVGELEFLNEVVKISKKRKMK